MENQPVPFEEKGEIVLYQLDDNVRLEVRLQDDTVWLTQQQMTELFRTTKQNVSLHINNIFREGELTRVSVVKESFTTANDGKNYKTKFYNLDVIISVGYRIKSPIGTRFRQWATAVLKDYLLRGYAVHQQTMALQQINLRIDAQNDRIARIEDNIERQQQQLDFVVRANEKPEELLIPTGCVWDAYTFISGLVRRAEKRVVLIDNFVDERTLLLLDKREAGVECTVHTRYTKQAELDFEKHNKQCAEIKKVQLPQHIHDRYLIVDDTVWLLGASVKDMGHGLCTVIKVGFTPEAVLGLLK